MNQPQTKVVVGIPVNLFPAVDRKFYKNKELQLAESSMCEAVANAGGLPLLLPISSESDVPQLIDGIDGLLLAGGADISPPCYGEEAVHPDWAGQPRRDAFEIALYKEARKKQKPVLGICRGIQMINVVEGGSLWQDLVSQREGSDVHRSQEQYDALAHTLRVLPGSVLESILGAAQTDVNTVHHQGLKEIAPTLTPIAWSPDGLVEAVIHESPPFTFGVQWHPEWMRDSSQQKSLFRYFLQEVEKTREY